MRPSSLSFLSAKPLRSLRLCGESASQRFSLLCCVKNQAGDFSNKRAWAALQFSKIVSVELHSNRSFVLWDIFHLRQISREPSAVTVADSPLRFADLNAQPIFVTAASFGRNGVQQVFQTGPIKHFTFV